MSMATLKIKFRASTVRGAEGTLYFQIIHRRLLRLVCTGYKLYPEEWDKAKEKVCYLHAGAGRHAYLAALECRLSKDEELLRGVIRRFEQAGEEYTSVQVVEAYSSESGGRGTFVAYARSLVARLADIGRCRLSETYLASINSFVRFRGGNGDLPLAGIDSVLMMEYESYLKSCRLSLNTISFYMRNLRAIYNRAVEEGLVATRHPFSRVYTGVEKTAKRAVPSGTISQIRRLDLSSHPMMELARDLFLFSFYMRGMSFVDMAFLKKADLRGGLLVYRRHKTDQQLSVKWEKPMQDIVDKYWNPASPFLLPIIKVAGEGERRQYLNASHLMNKNLKRVGRMVGCPVELTFYVARHGWASIAKSKNIAVSVISEAMGHDSENTTRIYLASLDTSLVDQANNAVMDSVL